MAITSYFLQIHVLKHDIRSGSSWDFRYRNSVMTQYLWAPLITIQSTFLSHLNVYSQLN